MSERYLYGPRQPSSERSVEWQLPAALAVKHALVIAVDSLLPEALEEGSDRRIYQFTDDEAVTIARSSMFGATTWSLDFGPMPRYNDRRVAYTSGGFIVDVNRNATYQEEMATRYELTKKGEDDISLYKTGWVGKNDGDDPVEVSQGEARAILHELAEFEGAEEV